MRQLAAILILAGAALLAAEIIHAPIPHVYPIEIDRLRDADTPVADVDVGLGLTLNNEAIRLDDVDAPERNTPDGKAATEFTERWIADNKPLYFVPNRKRYRDNFGRLLGKIYSHEGQSLSTAIKDAGHVKTPAN